MRSSEIEQAILQLSRKAMELLGPPGKMTHRSKSEGGPESIFNANLFNEKAEKIWFGDLELSREHDRNALSELSRTEGPVYILYESDGRFLRTMPTPGYVRGVAAITAVDGQLVYSEAHKELMKGLAERKKRMEEAMKSRRRR